MKGLFHKSLKGPGEGPGLPPGPVVPLRRQRDYRLYWTARTISLSGSEVSRLAIPLTAATLLGASPMEMGLLGAAATLPHLLVGLPAGVIADRLPRRRPLMIACELVAAAAAAAVPLIWYLGALTIPYLLAVAFVVGCCTVLFRAADFPYLLAVVPAEQRTEAFAGSQAAQSVASVGGPGLAGVLVQALTAPLAVLAEAVSFLISALLLRSVRTTEAHAPAATRGMWRDIWDGLHLSVANPTLRALLGAGATHNFFASAYIAIYLLYTLHELDLPPGLIGALTACFGIGGILGAAAVPRLTRRFGDERILLGSVLLFPADYVIVALAGGPLAVKAAVLGAAALGVGALIVAFATCMNTVTVREIKTEYLGRVKATTAFAVQGVLTLGGLAGGALGEILGLRPVIWVCAAGALLSIPWIWLSPLRRGRSRG
ncbi:MFS transporter [Spongiactinospora sp. TRM90649]|uniref:MFS transporter n=1 Tax=Spongiactinospora sp. TRM90649 TaxID=3031114 RepID=UPI0023F9E924|nr:MFS transporter [Spongiactinospora sp. TRM90649]MDF5752721.1 MFS transporter [Spongiactinospora sp. TRM90649]